MTSLQMAALLMILAFVVFVVGATLPVIGPRGELNIFTLPAHEQLLAVARNQIRWRWGNVLMGGAFVVLVVGVQILASAIETQDGGVLSRAAQDGLLAAAVLWLLFSAFRATVTIQAAQEIVSTGRMPDYYVPVSRWARAVFQIYIGLGCLALTALGAALLASHVVVPWVGWATVILAASPLMHMLLTGDTLPGFHYFPTLLVGVVLLLDS